MWEYWFIFALCGLMSIFFKPNRITYASFLGAVLTMLCTFFLYQPFIQIGCFILFYGLTFFLLTHYFPLYKNHTFKRTTELTNLLNQTGVVTRYVGTHFLQSGLVKLDGEIWPAKSSYKHGIIPGTPVCIQRIQGIYLIVQPLPKTHKHKIKKGGNTYNK